MNPSNIYPRTGDTQTVYLNQVVTDPNILVGDYTMYNDFVHDPVDFEKNNVLYHYPVNHDRLVIGKFCSIACGAKFLFNSANHSLQSFSTYPKPKQVSANVLTPAEVEDYLDAAERLGHLPMFLLALTAGLRQGELIALKWSDLDVRERILTVTEKRSVERRELVEYEGGTRIVSLTSEAVELLRLEHAKHPGSPLMFMHPATQRPYSPQMVRRLHNEIIQEAGLDHIRFADLRHTCAVLSLKNGMDTKEVSQMLGHFRIAMTRQNYAPYLAHTAAKSESKPNEASTEDLRKAAKILDNLLKF